jgi:hypothetical protein
VFDVFEGGLVVMPLRDARRLAGLNGALPSSSTWGEFLGRAETDLETQTYLREHYEDGLPGRDEPFEADELPGFADGVWPADPRQAMFDWLPAAILELGAVRERLLNGQRVHLDEDLQDQVIDALAAEGIECRIDVEDLVAGSCGAWRMG